jgi:protein-disulfide isomerase
MKRAFLIATAFALLFGPIGCRDPLAGDREDYIPDAGDYDAGSDDSGPGELCPPGTPDLFHNEHSPYFGGEVSADLEIVEFAHFHCPYCVTFYELTHEIWNRRDDFRDRVRVYYHHFPFSYEESWRIQAASVAAFRQGMEHFWAMHDWFYDSMAQDPPIERIGDEAIAFAQDQLGLDMEQFLADMESPQTIDFLSWDKDQGLAAGVSGTPSVFICGQRISNNKEGLWGEGSFEAIVDSYLDN